MEKKRFTLLEAIKNILIGAVLGIANVIPGVSGGTMAVVLRIYDKLIAILTIDIKFIKKEWRFIVTFIIGAAVAIFALAKVMKFLLETYPVATNLFFVGVVAGTCPFIWKTTSASKGANGAKVLPAILMLLVMILFTLMQNSVESSSYSVMTTLTVGSGLKLFFCMALAAAAMIIPGISGSFVALALGVYPTVMEAISTLNIGLLIPIGLGILLGLIGGAKLIRLLLEKFPGATFSAILGLLVGSIVALVYPIAGSFALNWELLIGVLLTVIGFVISVVFCRSEEKSEEKQAA